MRRSRMAQDVLTDTGPCPDMAENGPLADFAFDMADLSTDVEALTFDMADLTFDMTGLEFDLSQLTTTGHLNA